MTARVLPNGNYLLAWCGYPATIMEVNAKGEILSKTVGNKEKLGSLDIVLIHLANDISSLEIQLYEAMGITASDQIITVIQRSHAKRVTVYFHGISFFPIRKGRS